MLDAGVRHLPVVKDGDPVGMVSMRDLLHLETWL
jgi:signal-transduction protein with cAMP-binding, CBS, and nucleotidyltransferase domain